MQSSDVVNTYQLTGEVQAIQWTGENFPAIQAFVESPGNKARAFPEAVEPGVYPSYFWLYENEDVQELQVPYGLHVPRVRVGDWVLQLGPGKFERCSDEEFQRYRAAHPSENLTKLLERLPEMLAFSSQVSQDEMIWSENATLERMNHTQLEKALHVGEKPSGKFKEVLQAFKDGKFSSTIPFSAEIIRMMEDDQRRTLENERRGIQDTGEFLLSERERRLLSMSPNLELIPDYTRRSPEITSFDTTPLPGPDPEERSVPEDAPLTDHEKLRERVNAEQVSYDAVRASICDELTIEAQFEKLWPDNSCFFESERRIRKGAIAIVAHITEQIRSRMLRDNAVIDMQSVIHEYVSSTNDRVKDLQDATAMLDGRSEATNALLREVLRLVQISESAPGTSRAGELIDAQKFQDLVCEDFKSQQAWGKNLQDQVTRIEDRLTGIEKSLTPKKKHDDFLDMLPGANLGYSSQISPPKLDLRNLVTELDKVVASHGSQITMVREFVQGPFGENRVKVLERRITTQERWGIEESKRTQKLRDDIDKLFTENSDLRIRCKSLEKLAGITWADSATVSPATKDRLEYGG